MDIFDLLKALANTNSTKEKLKLLQTHKDMEGLKDIFKYAYDRITYTYGVTSSTINKFTDIDGQFKRSNLPKISNAFELLDKLSDRTYTGNDALALCAEMSQACGQEEGDLFLNIIDRDLKVGVSEKTINKVWKGLIPKPNYNRCAVFSSKTAEKIHFPAYLQLKCDGTYREVHVCDGKVTIRTRAGEPAENPVVAEQIKDFPDGYYLGEFTIGKATEPDCNRSIGNGLINSDNPPYKDIHFTVWDYLSEDDYSGKEPSIYLYRFKALEGIIEAHRSENIELVPSYLVNDAKAALERSSEFMNQGLEGGVLKDTNMIFKNGTNQQQLKIKLKVDCEMRIKGFTEGTGKREGYVGAIIFENDEGTVKGQCSGFSEAQMIEFTKSKEQYINKIISVEFNDLTKSDSNDFYALMHPRFIEIRNDKNETDTLEKVIQLRDMAKTL